MNCSQYEPWIALYVEGDLSSSKTRDLQGHLQTCSLCLEFVNELRKSQTLLKSLAEEPLPESAFTTVRERVLKQVSHRRSTPQTWWAALPAFSQWRPVLAAGFAILVGLGLIWLQFSRQPAGSQRSVEPNLSATQPAQPNAPQPVPERNPPSEKAKPRDDEPVQVASVGRPRRPRRHAPQELIFPPAEPVASTEEAPEELQQGTILEPESPPATDVPPEEPPPLVIKLVTDDPNIVIVWLVDQNVDSK